MKGKLIAFAGILCITSLIVSGANAKGKPDKPGNPETELIVFTEDLEGNQLVEGCCPNAGPFPQYEMTLAFEVDDDHPANTTYGGSLFMNQYGAGRDRRYIVQFWNNEIAIEIIGGEIYKDKKTKTLTVVFTDEMCVDRGTKDFIATVSFVLVRTPD